MVLPKVCSQNRQFIRTYDILLSSPDEHNQEQEVGEDKSNGKSRN